MLGDNVLRDRVATAVRNILSGNQACGTLDKAAQAGDAAYFEKMIAPVMATYAAEMRELRMQRDAILELSEQRRQALAFVESNGRPPPDLHQLALAK